jgi:NADPH-dependent 2,4-dienoyl-CoA reductase/sulfur reductase-like enzyme
MPESHIVIIGAGPAGGTAAKTLRERGFTGRITLVGSEPDRPYIRPPLSKQYLRGEVERESVFLDAASWYDEHDVDLRLAATATSIDPSAHRVHLESGETLTYDSLLLATGSTPRRLDIDGADLAGVHTLRTIGNAEALHEGLAGGGRRVVVIGSGWIGMEVAASARLLGNDVTVLDRNEHPLSSALGDALGAVIADLHESHGVVIRPRVEVAAFVGESGAVTGVRLSGGEVIPADLVLVGIGAAPNLDLARAAGLTVDDGLLVDERLRSSDPDVYAAGDIANAYHPLGEVRIRSEHLSNAFKGGTAVARVMLGEDVRYDDLPTFVSEQYDVTIQFAGYAPLIPGTRQVFRGDPASGAFTTVWLAGDRAVAGVHVNVKDPEKKLQGLVRSARAVDATRLADLDVDLGEV